MDEIEVNGKKYVLKNKANIGKLPVVDKKGLTYCIVRTYSAGVFAGWFDTKTKGKEGTVFEARRLWHWDGANSLSELCMKGVGKPNNCKFPIAVPMVVLKEIIEVLPCTDVAKESIENVREWSQ